jgi:phosphoglycolate phosphatase-like HAD superfamily hydrolase
MTRPLAVVFDVDGVLVDSLPAHLEMCAELSREFGLGLVIPGVDEFRRLVRRGVIISPMQEFFRAVGFPEDLAREADREYDRSFATRFSPAPFAGVAEMLAGLQLAGVELGIVSSNTRVNVEKALGSLMAAFPTARVFTRDHARASTKVQALRMLADELGLPKERIVYVGDQPADAIAARAAGLSFIGVTYGWGFEPGDDGVPGLAEGCVLVERPAALGAYLLGTSR